MVQIHKEFIDSQVKELIERYLKNEIERKYIQEVLGIGKTRFFALIKLGISHPFKLSLLQDSQKFQLYFSFSESLLTH